MIHGPSHLRTQTVGQPEDGDQDGDRSTVWWKAEELYSIPYGGFEPLHDREGDSSGQECGRSREKKGVGRTWGGFGLQPTLAPESQNRRTRAVCRRVQLQAVSSDTG